MKLVLADGTRWHARTWDAFWSRVDASGDCWEWSGSKFANGYGSFSDILTAPPRKTWLAHRVAYGALVGSIEGSIDHLCRNKACVNPDHLEAVSRGENVLRGFGTSAMNARKTHCVHGHAFTPENTHIRKEGDRECRACMRDRTNRYNWAKGVKRRQYRNR